MSTESEEPTGAPEPLASGGIRFHALVAGLQQRLGNLLQVDVHALLANETGRDLLRSVVDMASGLQSITGKLAEARFGQLITAAAQLLSLSVLREIHTRLMARRREAQAEPPAEPIVSVFEDAARFVEALRIAGRLLEDDVQRDEAQGLLSFWANVLYRAGRPIDVDYLDDFDPRLAPTIPDNHCPYLGLDAFHEHDAGRFFGRQRTIEQVVRLLAERRLIAIVGPSGSGKSSVVRAGLLPSLQRSALASSAEWRYPTSMIPGSQPLSNLAAVIEKMLSPEQLPGSENQSSQQHFNFSLVPHLPYVVQHRRNELSRDGRAILGMIPSTTDRPIVLTVDQFEETFTLCTDEAERTQFLNALIALATDESAPHRVILTMRSDFEPFVARADALLPLFEQGKVNLSPLSAAELREAIERPAEGIGLRFESGVVEALLQDILGEPAALPLLQFTLLKLWEHRERNRITLAAYRKVGGGRLALANAADALYASLIPEDQVTARRILLRMVRPGEGLEVTSNRIRRADLLALGEDPGRVERVLHKLVEAHLVRLTTGDSRADDQLEVAHEALVRNWPTLVEWLEDERVALRQRQRLNAAAEQWERHGRDPSTLLRGALLNEARRYDDLSLLEREFVQAGIDDQQRIEGEREATIQRLEQLTAELEQQRRIADIQRLAFAAQSMAQTDPEVALLLAAEAASRQDNPVTRQALHLMLIQVHRFPTILDEHHSPLMATAVSPDGTRFATGSADGLVCLWSVDGSLIGRFSGHKNVIASMVFSPDGRLLLTGSRDGTARLWDLDSGRVRKVIREHTNTVSAVSWSPDGAFFVTASRDTRAIVWSPNGRLHTILEGHTGWLRDVSVSPDGKWIVTASRDQTARVWTPTGHLVTELTGHRDGLIRALFSPNGQQILTCSWDGDARLWLHHGKGQVSQILEGHRGPITDAGFNSDGSLIATTSWDGTTRLWDNTGHTLTVFTGHAGLLQSVTFSQDSELIITGSSDGTAKIWDLDGHVVDILGGHSEKIGHALFLRGDKDVLTVSRDGTARIWGEPVAPYRTFESQSGAINAVAVNSDGHKILTAADDGTAYLWSNDDEPRSVLRSGQSQRSVAFSPDGTLIAIGGDLGAFLFGVQDVTHIVELPHGAPVLSIAFSFDGQRIITGGEDHRALIWSISGELIGSCEGHEGSIRAAVWFPDHSGRSVTVSMDWLFRVWAADGTLLAQRDRAHAAWILSAAMSPDGRRLITGSADKSACVWDVETWRPMIEVSHSGWVEGLASMPNGHGFASASRDGTVRLWAWDGTLQHALPGHVGGARSLVFSPDGSSVIVGSGDGSVRIYPILIEDLLKLAAARVGRGLTDEEIAQFNVPTPLVFAGLKRRKPLPRSSIMGED